jgi:hypothetical protein
MRIARTRNVLGMRVSVMLNRTVPQITVRLLWSNIATVVAFLARMKFNSDHWVYGHIPVVIEFKITGNIYLCGSCLAFSMLRTRYLVWNIGPYRLELSDDRGNQWRKRPTLFFWVVTPGRLVSRNSLHLQPWRCRHIFPKRSYLPTSLHGVRIQKSDIVILTAVITSNVMRYLVSRQRFEPRSARL